MAEFLKPRGEQDCCEKYCIERQRRANTLSHVVEHDLSFDHVVVIEGQVENNEY